MHNQFYRGPDGQFLLAAVHALMDRDHKTALRLLTLPEVARNRTSMGGSSILADILLSQAQEEPVVDASS